MGVWRNIVGTFESAFFIKKGGSQIKDNSGDFDFRNNDDSDYIKLRIKDPTADEHAATKSYVDSLENANAMRAIKIPITTSTPATSTATIPANSVVFDCWVDITTLYDNSATITVGQTGTLNLIQDTTDNDAETVGTYSKQQATDWGGSALAVIVTIANTPTAGAGTVYVFYSEPAT